MKSESLTTAVPDKRIIDFIKQQTVLTLATCLTGEPYCATCFFAYSEEFNALVFKSSAETLHISQALANSKVAGSVLPDKLVTGKVKGLQYSGSFLQPEGDMLNAMQKSYYKKYPFALPMKGILWAVVLTKLKFTDNTLGFGTKLKWNAQAGEKI